MTEDFLHFIWKYGLFDRNGILTDTNEEIKIISLGEHNQDAGPDFINARIKIGQTTWAGNVEIHLKSSDWRNHKHHLDKSYDNVILHVVYNHDKTVFRANGEIIPSIVLSFEPHLYANYKALLNGDNGLLCYTKLKKIDALIIDVWLNSLVIERLIQKTQYILSLLNLYKNNWEEVFFISLARSFGFGLNAVPFEMVARSIPISLLGRHRDNLMQIEALLFGQAGFLEEAILFSGYYETLRREYIHLKKKYELKPVETHLWKFLRLRPVNFPTIRIAQYASVMFNGEGLFSKVLECNSIGDLEKMMGVSASEFWNTHYTFNSVTEHSVKRLGIEAIHNIIINTIIPFLFVYGNTIGNENIKDRALFWLTKIPAEKNKVIHRWEISGIKPDSASVSQGLLQLNNMYCMRKRCLSCSIGMHIITSIGNQI